MDKLTNLDELVLAIIFNDRQPTCNKILTLVCDLLGHYTRSSIQRSLTTLTDHELIEEGYERYNKVYRVTLMGMDIVKESGYVGI